ncbi:MAG: hypothetical protein ACO1G9_04635 [Bacteroidota bacterium]
MKRNYFLLAVLLIIGFSPVSLKAQDESGPDTVNVGIYITSIHDIDFRQKEYSVNLWLWLKYRNKEFDFMRNLEVPMAKSVEKSYATIDTLEDGRIYMLMKLQCVMKGTWKINDFPFDRQKLRFAIENSMYDSKALIFSVDTVGKHYGKYFLMGWEKDSFNLKTEIRKYETAFGDPELDKPESEYSSFKATIVVHRNSWEMFFKIFLGMYISFLISTICFFVHPDNMESRLALSVGSLFAVIGNKYIIDSSLPESNTFTMVDTLHGLTLLYIFLVIASSVYTLRLVRAGFENRSEKQNRMMGWILLLFYVALNLWVILSSYNTIATG